MFEIICLGGTLFSMYILNYLIKTDQNWYKI